MAQAPRIRNPSYHRALAAIAAVGVMAAAGCSGSARKAGVAKPESLLDTRCAECHELTRVMKARFDRAGWEKVVDQMVKRGARLNVDERQVLIDYLSERNRQ